MHILGWVLMGFLVGLLARAIMPGRDPMGMIGTTILGIVGALLAGWIGRVLGFYAQGQGAGLIMAIIGAIVVLAIYYAVVGRNTKALPHRDRGDRSRAA